MTFDLDLENLHLDIDASNVVGLGASVVACDIINSINDSPYFSINNIYLPQRVYATIPLIFPLMLLFIFQRVFS